MSDLYSVILFIYGIIGLYCAEYAVRVKGSDRSYLVLYLAWPYCLLKALFTNKAQRTQVTEGEMLKLMHITLLQTKEVLKNMDERITKLEGDRK